LLLFEALFRNLSITSRPISSDARLVWWTFSLILSLTISISDSICFHYHEDEFKTIYILTS
jgi:hypothetical protein